MKVRELFDKKQVLRVTNRAERMQTAGADFLLQRILVDFLDRLSVTKRTFERALYVSAWPSISGEVLSQADSITQLGGVDRTHAQFENELLGIETASADLMLDILNLHQTNDVLGALIQYRRALVEDGLFLACVPGGDMLPELRTSLQVAEVEVSGGLHPRVLPFMDVRDAGGLLQRAGFALPVTDVETVCVRYDTMFDLMLDLRAMGATNTLLERKKALTCRGLFNRAARHYAENFADQDGRIRATFSFIWMSGWSPSEQQPRPLKPGSATHSLAQVLGDKTKQ